VFDRDFAQGGAALRGSPAAGLILDLRHQRRAFGAAGFYGNSPSKEWTDQTLAGVSWQTSHNSWITTARGLVRHHADHFLWDIIRPEISRNRHRTNAGEGSVTLARDLGAGRRFTVGASGGGDWVASTNLGDRHFAKIGALAELLLPVGTRATVQAAARFDGYSTFGRNLSPSASVAVWPVSSLRLRASAGRAFRVPTFTELYYHDPGNLGNPDLVAERGWTLDGGVDWIHRDWTLSASPFRRWDNDVIDWVKPTAPDLWRSANVRDVTSTGVELSVSRAWRQAIVRASYATLTVDAPALPVISKYLLEYAKHQAAGSVSLPIGGGLRAAINIDHRRRLDGQEYSLVGARISRTISRFKVFVDATNLLDEQYHEVAGVAMPGRWMTVGVDIR
jgi:iron complex outermembrane receptor protein